MQRVKRMGRASGVMTCLALLLGCVGGDGSGTSSAKSASEFNYVAMMANYADNLIVPQYQQFVQASAELAGETGAVAEYCAALGTGAEQSALQTAQQAWRDSMDVWQQAELLLVGPVAANGAAQRNRIYSFASSSSLSTCAVDQAVVLAQDPDFDVQQRSFNSRGLDALEYLLFNESLAHTCPARITETADWNERSQSDRKAIRCAYAQSLAEDITAAASELVDAWTEEGANYRYQFVDPANQEANLKALSDALFYIETETKDAKLGMPTGIHSACSQLACPEAAESKYSETSFANIRENLIAFRRGLMGGDGPGFDDLIVAEGFPEVVTKFNQQVDAALAQLDSMDQSLYQQTQDLLASGNASACSNSATNPDAIQTVPACSLQGLVKRITDAMRTDFVTIVNLDLPDRAQSDND